jgi:hypothetical protein
MRQPAEPEPLKWARRVSGCMAYADACALLHEAAAGLRALGSPESVSMERYGRGWALYRHRPLTGP